MLRPRFCGRCWKKLACMFRSWACSGCCAGGAAARPRPQTHIWPTTCFRGGIAIGGFDDMFITCACLLDSASQDAHLVLQPDELAGARSCLPPLRDASCTAVTAPCSRQVGVLGRAAVKWSGRLSDSRPGCPRSRLDPRAHVRRHRRAEGCRAAGAAAGQGPWRVRVFQLLPLTAACKRATRGSPSHLHYSRHDVPPKSFSAGDNFNCRRRHLE